MLGHVGLEVVVLEEFDSGEVDLEEIGLVGSALLESGPLAAVFVGFGLEVVREEPEPWVEIGLVDQTKIDLVEAERALVWWKVQFAGLL